MSIMGFSMDGLRNNMIYKSNCLHRKINSIIEDLGREEAEEIKESFNELACSIGFLCCTFNKEVENYSDMSEQSDSIKKFEEEDEDEED